MSLDEYVGRMKEGQNDIFYAVEVESRALEEMKKRRVEVLYMLDPIDRLWVQRLGSYGGKKFVNIEVREQELHVRSLVLLCTVGVPSPASSTSSFRPMPISERASSQACGSSPKTCCTASAVPTLELRSKTSSSLRGP